ncbi:MAG: GYDIA family GHMP kinase [Altibacter sp.]|nr:GYDIA family GHMP kinase [Altibacter sp.]
MERTFYSNGKLLLTGEYVVLDGATALAFPTRYGQSLTVEAGDEQGVHWSSLDPDGSQWFETFLSFDNGKLQPKGSDPVSQTLASILNAALELQPQFIAPHASIRVTTALDFRRDWGLGSSSTLITNIAAWAQIDPFLLLENSFGGSGYDIAAALSNSPFLYERFAAKPTYRPVHLPWEFKAQLFFVHLNQKQDSKAGIRRYEKASVAPQMLRKISDISNKLLLCYSLSDFEALLEAHETIISEIIQLPTVKASRFPDYPNTVKSLGAWGGDFILATGTENDQAYFRKKGYTTLIPFTEMIL